MVEGSKVAYTFSVVSTDECPSMLILSLYPQCCSVQGWQRCALQYGSAAEMASVSCPPVYGEKCLWSCSLSSESLSGSHNY